jgi:hypothetical protein
MSRKTRQSALLPATVLFAFLEKPVTYSPRRNVVNHLFIYFRFTKAGKNGDLGDIHKLPKMNCACFVGLEVLTSSNHD